MNHITAPAPDLSPIEVASAAYAAIRNRDWPSFVALVDPSAAEDFKREQRGFAAMSLHVAQMPGETPAPADASEPMSGSDSSLLRPVFRVKSLDEFDALAASEVVGRFMQVRYRAPRELDASSREEQSFIGVVHESPDVAHVVVRVTVHFAKEVAQEATAFGFFAASRSWVDVLTLRRRSTGWRAHLNGGLITSGGGGFSIGYDRTDDEHHGASALRTLQLTSDLRITAKQVETRGDIRSSKR